MSLRNFDRAIPKRKYRERHQPEHRQRLGVLEKHPDYKLRAQDYHRKEDELASLREQAYTRNPEEFYFKMINSQLKDGVHVETEPQAEDSVLKKRKTQDANILLMRTQSQRHRIERLKSGLHLLDQPLTNTHILFVKDEDALQAVDPAQYFKTDSALLHTRNRLSVEQLQMQEIEEHEAPERTDYEALQETAETTDTLEQLMKEVEKDKLMLTKERKTMVDEEKRVFKFFRERKR